MASLRCEHTDIRLQRKLVYPIRKKRINKNSKKKRNKEIRDYSLPKSYRVKNGEPILVFLFYPVRQNKSKRKYK